MPSSWRLLACAGVSSALLYASFFPINFGWLAWVAFVPWLSLAACERHPRLYLLCWLGALPVAFGCLSWVPVADWRMSFAWLVLGTYFSLHYPLALYLVRLLWRRLGLALTFSFPLVWVAMEYFRANFAGGFATLILGHYRHDWPGGFAWFLLGHSQHEFLEAVQIADLGGVYAVSFVVAMANGLLYEAVAARWQKPRFTPQALLVQAVIVGVVLGGTLGYGMWRLRQEADVPGPRIALLQGSIDQRIRNAVWFDDRMREEAFRTQEEEYRGLCRLAMEQKPLMLVWPETARPGAWAEMDGRPLPKPAESADKLVADFPAAHLIGLNVVEFRDDLNNPLEFNSALLFGQGNPRLLDRYDKAHRVPFGEYIPMQRWLKFLSWLAPYPGDYGVTPGKRFTRFSIPGATFGVMICYEDTVAAIGREYAGVDFLVNISNDGWFDGTSEHDQHLAISRFRAVEARRSLVRAVNMGVSAVIDGSGRVLTPRQYYPGGAAWVVPPRQRRSMPANEWGRFKKMSCVVVADVPIDSRPSVYALIGDAFAQLLCVLLLTALIVCRWSKPHDDPAAPAAEEHGPGRPVPA